MSPLPFAFCGFFSLYVIRKKSPRLREPEASAALALMP